MATLEELAGLSGTDSYEALVQKITAAVSIKAVAIAALPTPTAEQTAWARNALAAPRATANEVVNFVIASNAGATTVQILEATDADIQSNVNSAVDNLLSK